MVVVDAYQAILYDYIMHQLRLTGLLLGPSVLSGSVALLASFCILAVSNWLYITPDNPLYNYLYGPYGITTVFQNSSNALTAINGAFSSPSAYNIAVLIFALLVGLMVFAFLQGIDAIADHTKEEIQEVTYVSDQALRKRMRKQAGLRFAIRLATGITWVMYLIFLCRVIVPYCLLLGQLDTQNLWTISNLWQSLAAFLGLSLGFHMSVIFMRLTVLRPRLFGGDPVLGNDGGH